MRDVCGRELKIEDVILSLDLGLSGTIVEFVVDKKTKQEVVRVKFDAENDIITDCIGVPLLMKID